MTIPQRGGLPHSDIHGSKPARGSPWLFAACHVLHRLLVPRHPPNALLILHTKRQSSVVSRIIANLNPQSQNQEPNTNNSQPRMSIASVYSALIHNAPDHYHRIERDDPSSTFACTTDPFRSDNHPTPRRTNPAAIQTSATRQPDHNRVVLRTQGRTRTRFTTQKNNATAQASPHGGNTACQTTPRSRGQDQQRRSRIHPISHTNQPEPKRAVAAAPCPAEHNMETIGFEPMTPCLQSRCSTN